MSGETTEKARDRIGRYKLLREIGEGCCSVVYMAEGGIRPPPWFRSVPMALSATPMPLPPE
ncbi:MAG: hypothetical protein ABSA12_15520 [Verrucomicrobiia bacterium]|jgi:hypothetical protein